MLVAIDDGEHLVRVLRREWIRSGLTLKQVAERMGVATPQQVSAFLDGRDVRVSTGCRLARALGFEVALVEAETRG